MTFDDSFVKIQSCGSTTYGLCAGTEADPSSNMNKYLTNDLFWVGGTCVSCPSGWTQLNGNCFQAFTDKLAYDGAKASCEAKNASLANLNTEAKFNLVKSIITQASIVSNCLCNKN